MTNIIEEKPLAEYAELLKDPVTGKYVIPDYPFEAVYIGPSWARNEHGDFVIPEYTLGWQAIKWAETYLLNDEGEPWRFTNEQKRFLLWWYAVDVRGVFTYRDGILQRLKGW